MQAAIEAFRDCIARVEHLGGLHRATASLMTPAVDLSDLLRAQVVLTVSALDYYIHEVTVLGMVEIFEGRRPATDAFRRFRISLSAAPHGAVTSRLLENEIRERHSYLSFQQPDKIADALRNISSIQLWKEVAAQVGVPENSLKSQLRLIVDRRNKIAHEADIDPSYPGSRWPISRSDVAESLSFVQRIGESIHSLLA